MTDGVLPPGPATLAGVKAHLTIDDTADDTPLEGIVAAVNDVVRHLPSAGPVVGLDEWPASSRLGANMLAARLLRRRNSPEGVAAFAGDAAVYVQRNDPDVAMLLGLGDWSTPGVG